MQHSAMVDIIFNETSLIAIETVNVTHVCYSFLLFHLFLFYLMILHSMLSRNDNKTLQQLQQLKHKLHIKLLAIQAMIDVLYDMIDFLSCMFGKIFTVELFNVYVLLGHQWWGN